MNRERYCKEKLDASHSKGIKELRRASVEGKCSRSESSFNFAQERKKENDE